MRFVFDTTHKLVEGWVRVHPRTPAKKEKPTIATALIDDETTYVWIAWIALHGPLGAIGSDHSDLCRPVHDKFELGGSGV